MFLHQVSDPIAGREIATLSGSVSAQSFYSSSARMTVAFQTDDSVFLTGFRMTWEEEDIPTTTTTSTTVPPSTTPHGRIAQYMINNLQTIISGPCSLASAVTYIL